MYKISISGKANSGKNTLSKLLLNQLWQGPTWMHKYEFIAFADPIKKMAHIAFPNIPRKWLYGPSRYRDNIIPNAYKNNVPLTVRQLLMDLGNDFGRQYQSDIWINNIDLRLKKIYEKQPKVIILTDCRFRKEFDYLKQSNFFQIRIKRDNCKEINDISELDQSNILDSEFDNIIDNNGPLLYLKNQVSQIVKRLQL